jgi:hypothetical protein
VLPRDFFDLISEEGACELATLHSLHSGPFFFFLFPRHPIKKKVLVCGEFIGKPIHFKD